MAFTETPLKKRKLHEAVGIDPHGFQQSFVSSSSQDEILRRQRNKAEIRSLYDCYRRIKFCISQKDARHMPDFEQAYLALITASRGCTSAQRILSELIPRYASYCPTALEAAAKVAINMYNWNFATIVRGDDFDGVAFQTAKACIFGLVDICCTASSEAPTSSVIRGICSAVFLNVITFFVSSYEGKDIYEISDEDIVKVRGSSELMSELNIKVEDEDGSALSKLFRLRALSLIRIFFCCPKKSLEACFETFKSSSPDVGSFEGGKYLLRQITTRILSADVNSANKATDEGTSCTGLGKPDMKGVSDSGETLKSDDSRSSDDASLVVKNCLLGMALTEDLSLRRWMLIKYKKLCKLLGSQAVSDISSAFEGIFRSFSDMVMEVDSQEDSDDDGSDPSKYIKKQYMIPRMHENPNERSDKDGTARLRNASNHDGTHEERGLDDKFSSQDRKSSSLVAPVLDIRSVNENLNHESKGSWPVKGLDTGDHGDSYRGIQHMNSSTYLSPVNKKPLNFSNDAFEAGNHLVRGEKNQIANDFSSPVMRSTPGSNVLASPEQSGRYHSSNHTVWYFDGDFAVMDVYSASKQLWLGSLGPDASETGVKFHVEKFGPVEQFLFFPIKGFALVQYMNMMDAIKAREYLRKSSPWGANLQVKFLDVGLGSRGSINGVAVGSSCHVYVGNVSSKWIKDEILHEVMKVGCRSPMVSDLTNESALLLEFDTAEDAAIIMAHLRKYRKEIGYHISVKRSLISKEGISDVSRCLMDGAKFIHSPVSTEQRSTISVSMPNSMPGSSHIPSVFDSPVDNYKMRMSQLSSLISSLSSKYNISRNRNANFARDDDRAPTSTLWIGLPHNNSTYLTEDELMSVCSHAVGNVGSIVRLTRDDMQMSPSWFVELSSVDAAITALKNLRSCPGMIFQIEFSQPGINCSMPLMSRPESVKHELISPRMESENRGSMVRSSQPFPMNYSKIDEPNNNMAVNLPQANHTGQMWTYKPEGSMQYPPMATQGPPPSFMRPPYLGRPQNSWDGHSINQPFPPNYAPNNFHINVAPPPPFIPPSVTPLSQIPPLPVVPPPVQPSPPPLPVSQPPLVPPPPNSPPPVPCTEERQWQGVLCKSGVNYCTVYAHREETDSCKYSNAISEPVGWPAKLDVTKRTDFQHVKSTYTIVPPHKREICRLLPSTSGDHKGYQDFISYLKQRECAGVIKIPAGNSMWARLLFILPQSQEICSMLGIAPHVSDSLIALVLPKETNFEWV